MVLSQFFHRGSLSEYLPSIHRYDLGEKRLSPQEWTQEIMNFYKLISAKNPKKSDAMVFHFYFSSSFIQPLSG